MLNYQTKGEVAVIHIDDGKANAISHAFIDQLTRALERARNEASAVALFGRPGRFSAGFDLSVVNAGGAAAQTLVAAGGAMLKVIYSHPLPVVVGCTGHAIAAGALILLAADSRIGAAGEFKIGLNETSIGAVLPPFALALADDRLSKRHQTAAIIQAELYDPIGAVDAGFLDLVVEPSALMEDTLAEATRLAALPNAAYAGNKVAIRTPFIERMS